VRGRAIDARSTCSCSGVDAHCIRDRREHHTAGSLEETNMTIASHRYRDLVAR
jgi:hypothetical protein